MRWLFWASQPESSKDNNNNIQRSENPKNEPGTINQCATCTSSLDSSAAPGPSTPVVDHKSPSRPRRDWNNIVNSTDWTQFAEPRNIIPTILLTGGILLSVHLHRKYLRRIPEVANISPTFFRRRSLIGRVTSVGDGDNFRIYHTPGGILAGWDWLRKIPTAKKELKNRTIHIRIAGIDAPELAHFGRPSQPFSQEAHTWLTNKLLHRRVRAYLYRPDQYGRVVATVYLRRWLFFPQDIGLQMLRHGFATVYEAKTGVEFGGKRLEKKYRETEAWAKKKGKGLWKAAQGKNASDWESPREFKKRMLGQEQGNDSSATNSKL